MPFYYHLGELPHKRHVQFRKPDGGLYREEVMGLEGFSGIESILYHHYLPPRLVRAEELGTTRPEYAPFGSLRHRAYATADVPAGGDPVAARRVLLGNADVTLGISRPSQSMSYFYRNAQAYEVWFAHEGSGVVHTQFGRLPFGPGDYLIPYGTTWRMDLDGTARFSSSKPRRRSNRRAATAMSSASCSSMRPTASATCGRPKRSKRTRSAASSRCG
jgi:homogentisate 1,2-dioxygenase